MVRVTKQDAENRDEEVDGKNNPYLSRKNRSGVGIYYAIKKNIYADKK